MSNEVIELDENDSVASEKLLPTLAPIAQLGTQGEIEARRAAIETLARVQVARAFPRKSQMAEVEDELKEICKDPQFAEKAIYAKPAGKDKNGVEKYIYGPSVFLAEEIARLYPNYEVKPIIYGARGEQTDCEVQVWDMEKNNRFPEPIAVTHWTWDGYNKRAVLETNPQKIRQMVRAELSKVKRNVIFATTPKLLQRKCYEWCEATNKLTAETLLKTSGGALKIFAEQFEVEEAKILNFLKIKEAKEITAAHVRLLRAVYASIKSGDWKASDIWKDAKDIPVRGESAQPAEAPVEKEKTKTNSTRGEKPGKEGKSSQATQKSESSEQTHSSETTSQSSSKSSAPEQSTSSESTKESSSPESDASSTSSEESTSTNRTPPAKDVPTPEQAKNITAMFK